MRDKISIQRVELLHPAIRSSVSSFITKAEGALGIKLRVVQGLRTFDEQAALYAQGRTAPGQVVTNAKAGQSYHNYGLAIDLVEITANGANWNFHYEHLLPFATDFAWGGNFKSIKDRPHFEKTFGLDWKVMLLRHQTGDFIKGTNYIRL